jgi:phosphatidylglycerol lysyltransferase
MANPAKALPPGCEYYASQADMPAKAVAELERLAFEVGETYDAYLVTEPGREYFWLPDRRGVIGFNRWWKYLQIVGGLIADRQDHEELLDRFHEFIKANRWNATFFNVSRNDADLFRRRGFQIAKCGEEPIVRLDLATWRGKEYEWLRRQENYCKRQGMTCREVVDLESPEYREVLAPKLQEMSRVHVADTLHAREMQFFVGRFDALDLGSKRLWVGELDGEPVGLVVCNPCLGGAMWAVEIYRRLSDAPRGAVPYMMMQAMRKLQEEGVDYASLSLIPLVRVAQPFHRDDSWIFQGVSWFWWRYMNWVFDVHGIYHFKSRFRPHYREMYVAVWPRVTVLSMWALQSAWGLLRFNPFRALRRAWAGRGKGRSQLADPPWRPERVIRELRPRSTEKTAMQPSESGDAKVGR